MSERFSAACGLLAVAKSDECEAVAGEHVRVARLGGVVEAVRLHQLGELHGYTAGLGYAIVSYDPNLSPVLVQPRCLERA